MSVYITIDGGTTNTRVTLVRDKVLIDGVKLSVGARKSIEDKEILKVEIKRAIETLLVKNHLGEKDIACILASGMITSEFGLCYIEHIMTPAGIRELHDGIEKIYLSEITDIPFAFIRGVKLSAESFESFDVMRGEETELMGIINADYGECIYILPGSHSKIIEVDAMGRIIDFSTMMTGEMISALSSQTILKDSVDLNISEIDNEYLLRGYDYSGKEGINKALFKTRILKNFCGRDKKEVYSFFLGTVLCGEIKQIIGNQAKTVVIGGRKQIKNAMAEILKKRDSKKVILIDETAVDMSTSIGAVRIYENI